MYLFDGSYDLTIDAHDYSGSGSAVVSGGKLAGTDDAFAISGTVREEGRTLGVSITFELHAPDRAPIDLRRNFILQTTLRETPTGFELLGAGPHGNICEICLFKKHPISG